MDTPYSQLNLNLNLDLEREAQQETKANGTEKVYKLKMSKRFEHIIFKIYTLKVANCFLLWQFLYLLLILKTCSVKLII